MMTEQQTREALEEISRYAARFWAGEAEIARAFFSEPRTREEHIRWLAVAVLQGAIRLGFVRFR